MTAPSAHRNDRFVQQHRRRLAILVLLVLIATAIAATGPLHRAILSVIAIAEPVIQQHAVAGAILYILLSAISAIVFFFSTALITPVAVDAFGPFAAFVLLWLGWILGGIFAYGIGRRFGRPVVSWFVDPVRIRDYERRAKGLVSFRYVLLFQLAVPSEIPGYVLGLARCRFRTFVTAMAIGELPFAIGAVYLGESFLERNYALLLAIGITGIAFSWMMFGRAAATWSSEHKTSDVAGTLRHIPM
ncbi:MAG TPA: VTT domain-containing protein [Thermoanaerobaculia bacterium]